MRLNKNSKIAINKKNPTPPDTVNDFIQLYNHKLSCVYFKNCIIIYN